MTREELVNYVATHTETPIETVKKYSNSRLLSAYLNYNGIIGYTNDIINVVEAAYNIKINENGET